MPGHVPHIYVPGPWVGSRLAPSESQRIHLEKVLRRDLSGSPISYTDGGGVVGHGSLESGWIMRGEETTIEDRVQLTVAVAPPKRRDRQRLIVEKLAELGVTRLSWLATEHGEGRAPSAIRSREWSIAALEQSRGGWMLDITPDLLAWGDLEPPVAVCHPGGSPSVPSPRTVAVGPEGGWSEGEIPATAALWSLGHRVLRVETAVIVAAARLS